MSLGRRGILAVLAVAAAAAVIALIVALVAGGNGISGDVNAFNACIGKSRFLTIARHRSAHTLIERISDRAHGGLVAEFAVFPSLHAEQTFTAPIGPPSGNGAGNGRLLVVTKAVTGRDADAVIGCETAPAFPLT